MSVSVIIPCYNPQRFLAECVDSVFAQTYAPHEVILVNDGSKEESGPLFAELQKRHPSLIRLDVRPNKGVAHARNHGVARSTGDLIAFIDQDDKWRPEKLALQVEALNAYPEYGYVTSRQRYFLSEGSEMPKWAKESQMDVSLPGFLPGTLMVRRATFNAMNGLDENLRFGTDDIDFFFRANTAGIKTAELPQDLLLKRIHGKNLSGQTLQGNKEILAVVRMNLARRKAGKHD